MAKMLPAPPEGVRLSPVPNLDASQAVNWFRAELGLALTPRYLKEYTTNGALPCAIIAGRRMYSTRDLYEFIVTRPSRKAPKRIAVAHGSNASTGGGR